MARWRRFLPLVATGVAATLMLVACGGGTDDEGGSDSGGRTSLDMWVFAELHATYYEQMAKLWNEENPDRQIDLNVTVYPYEDMHNKLLLAANSGSGLPDVVDIEVNQFSNFVAEDGRTPLSDLTEAAEPYRDDIVQARLDLYTRDGVVLGFPTHVGAFVAFYNTRLLEKAGIDYTTIKTWEDFQEAGAAYNKETGRAFGVASTGVDMVEPLIIAQLGGNFFAEDGHGAVAVNSPEVVEALELEQTMKEAGAISTIPGGSPDTEEAYGAINNGDYAAIVYPAWYTSRFVDYMPDLSGDIAIAPAPVAEGAEVATIGGGGTGTAVPEASPNKDIAQEWLAFAKLSPEANVAVWEVLGFDPVNMSIWEDKEVTHNPKNRFNKYFQTNLFDVLNQYKGDIGHFESFTNPSLPEVDDQMTTVTYTEIFENGVPAKAALDQAQSDLENQLGQ
jgi:arabinosaccharide transport system substrate-binding protein